MRRTLGMLAILHLLLSAQTAGADCSAQMAQCARNGENFCGFAVGVVCPFQCCPADWSGCCTVSDPNDASRQNPQCCPGPPDYTCAPACECVHPCSGSCCDSAKGEQCVQPSQPGSIGRCCPALQICGDNCCDPGQACTDGQCGCPINCGPRCCAADEKCIDANLGLCCSATREACGPKCCEVGEKCVDAEQGACCPVAKEACYGNFNSVLCCQPDQPCCADGSVCCAPGQDCIQNRCRCGKGKRACGGDDPSAPCCSDFEQCCPAGGSTHCEPIINTCCGQSSCPPGAACCASGQCYSPAFQRCCGVHHVCGLAEDCCNNAPGGCCPAGTHCCATAAGCCPNG